MTWMWRTQVQYETEGSLSLQQSPALLLPVSGWI